MSANSEQILKEALALPPQERAELVERLLATFQAPPDPSLMSFGRGSPRIAWPHTTGESSRPFRRRRCSRELDSGVRNENRVSEGGSSRIGGDH